MADRITGAWLTTDRAGVIAGVAASALHGARWVDDTEPIEILVDDRRRQPGLLVRMDRVADDEITVVDDLPVTALARTAFDLGRYQKRFAAIARLDAFDACSAVLRGRGVDADARYELCVECASCATSSFGRSRRSLPAGEQVATSVDRQRISDTRNPDPCLRR